MTTWTIQNDRLVQMQDGQPTGEERGLIEVLTAEQITAWDPTEADILQAIQNIEDESAAWGGLGTASAVLKGKRLRQYRNQLAALLNEMRQAVEPAVEIVDPPAMATVATDPEPEPAPEGEDGNGEEGDGSGEEGVSSVELVAANLTPNDSGDTNTAGTTVVVHDSAGLSDTDWSDLSGTNRLRAMMADLDEDVISQVTTAIDGPDVFNRLPIAAGIGRPGQGYHAQPSQNWAREAMQIANRYLGSDNTTEGTPLMQWMMAALNPFTGKPMQHLGNNPDVNRALLNDPDYRRACEAMFADLCGVPDLDRTRIDPCGVRTDEPILGAMSTPAPVGRGRLTFWQDIYDITMLGGTLPQIWYEADQNAVDPGDRSTWKGCATLPGCDNQVQVTMYMIPACLRICMEDEISRPEVIEQAQLIMRVLIARLAESYRLDVIDGYTGINGAVYQHDFSSTGYGAALEFYNMLCRITIGLSEFERKSLEEMDVIVPAHFAKLVHLDEVNSGVDRLQIGDVTSWMEAQVRAAGFRNLVITPDYGSAEGATFGPLAPGAGTGTLGDPYAQPPVVTPKYDAAAPTSPPQTSRPVPDLPTTACIRITNLQEFQPGLNTVVPWELRRSPDLLRQNCAEFFGESAQMLFKKGCSQTFRVDAYNICPNGARINEGVSPFTCP